MSTFDYNVDNYTITELFAILDLDDPDSNEIMNTTNKYITQFSPSNENQPQLVKFFQSIQTKLLRYMQELETSGKDAEYTPNEKQTNEIGINLVFIIYSLYSLLFKINYFSSPD